MTCLQLTCFVIPVSEFNIIIAMEIRKSTPILLWSLIINFSISFLRFLLRFR